MDGQAKIVLNLYIVIIKKEAYKKALSPDIPN
jgi:hypothetical protein